MSHIITHPTLRGGMLYLLINGQRRDAKGDFTYGFGLPKRTAIIGADGVHGFSTEAQVAFIEGAITDSLDLDLADIINVVGATLTLELQNGKVFVLREGAYVGEGSVATKEGEMAVRFEGMSAEEIRS